jgi:hypothetical protein
MKKLLMAIGLVGVIGGLAGCSDTGGGTDVGDVRNGHYLVVEKNDSHMTERDIRTGCTYEEANSDWSIHPVYGKDGKVKGCGDMNFGVLGANADDK